MNAHDERQIKHVDFEAYQAPKTPANEQRLNRLFAQIEQLTPNQLLILQDILNSWQI